jgi:signal transduction histidine kinase
VSHDLRNPLNVASIRLEQARQTGDDTYLDDVAGAHARMETLIADLLTLARVGSDSVNLESVDLASVTDSCWQAVVSTEATLQVETDRQILADRPRLRQLLENLLGNAVEHGSAGKQPPQGPDQPAGTRPVTVTIGELDAGDGFYVADDGPGIDRDQRDQVFTRGWSTADDGTGFGLTIVTEVVKAHDWQIDVTESAAGGARFEISGVEFE